MRIIKLIPILFLGSLSLSMSAQNPMNNSIHNNDSPNTELKIQLPADYFELHAYVHPMQAGFSISGYKYSLQLESYGTLLIAQPALSGSYYKKLQLPIYTQGLFCDFEDRINQRRKFRIDFSVK